MDSAEEAGWAVKLLASHALYLFHEVLSCITVAIEHVAGMY